jgi:tripartite-type tricarboxylate transporter receptor subunit TctC
MAGTTDFMVDTLAGVLPGVRGGQIRALAVTTRERSAVLPDVPTAAEAGLPGYESYNWHGIFTAAAVPAAIRARLEQAILGALGTPAVRRRIEEVGVDPRPSDAAAFAAFWDAQLALWIPIIRNSGATAD